MTEMPVNVVAAISSPVAKSQILSAPDSSAPSNREPSGLNTRPCGSSLEPLDGPGLYAGLGVPHLDRAPRAGVSEPFLVGADARRNTLAIGVDREPADDLRDAVSTTQT